jgi:O-methyltransferase involved in polyketide biosynthesis
LFYEGDRNNVSDYLTERGWDVLARNRRDLFGEYGRVYPDDDAFAAFRNIVSLIATRR